MSEIQTKMSEKMSENSDKNVLKFRQKCLKIQTFLSEKMSEIKTKMS